MHDTPVTELAATLLDPVYHSPWPLTGEGF